MNYRKYGMPMKPPAPSKRPPRRMKKKTPVVYKMVEPELHLTAEDIEQAVQVLKSMPTVPSITMDDVHEMVRKSLEENLYPLDLSIPPELEEGPSLIDYRLLYLPVLPKAVFIVEDKDDG